MSYALQPGFAEPPTESARAFRVLLNAMSRPGSIQNIPQGLASVGGFNRGSIMSALTLCDHESPIWLDEASGEDAAKYVRFHCGAPIVTDRTSAAFAFFSATHATSDFSGFADGTPDYPDTSTTLIIQVASLSNEPGGAPLSGPGIESVHNLNVEGLPIGFWAWLQTNNSRFPLGLDVILTTPDCIAALPRTVRMLEHT